MVATHAHPLPLFLNPRTPSPMTQPQALLTCPVCVGSPRVTGALSKVPYPLANYSIADLCECPFTYLLAPPQLPGLWLSAPSLSCFSPYYLFTSDPFLALLSPHPPQSMTLEMLLSKSTLPTQDSGLQLQAVAQSNCHSRPLPCPWPSCSP